MDYELLDQPITLIRDLSQTWVAPLQEMGLHLLYLLIIIELFWAGAQLALRRASVEEWAAMGIQQIMFAGLFIWFITNSQWLATSVIDSFRQAAGTATGFATTTPAESLRIGLTLAQRIFNNASIFTPTNDLICALGALGIIVCFVVVAGLTAITLIELYIVVAAAPLFLGFGGSRFTLPFALSLTRAIFSVGTKLFVIQILGGIANRIGNDWAIAFDPAAGQYPILVVVALSLFMAMLVFSVPSLLASFVSGGAPGGAGGLIAAVGLAAGAAGMAGGALGGVLRTGTGAVTSMTSGASLAAAQAASSGVELSRMGALMGAGRNAIGALGGAVMDRAASRSPLITAAQTMKAQAKNIRAELAKPEPKSDG